MKPPKFKEMIVRCPWCSAKIGEPCVDLKKKPYDDGVHNARKRAYENVPVKARRRIE